VAENPSIKDVVVVIPVIASSVAMTWEVGRFSYYGGYRYFTLTEHLAAATNYLPLAIIVSIPIIVLISFARLIGIPFFKDSSTIKPFGALIAFALGLFVTLILSAASTRNELLSLANNPDSPRSVIDIKLKDGGSKSAALIMSGDRGILVFNPHTRRSELIRWDDIKSLDWQDDDG
jgi:hypothetical protein